MNATMTMIQLTLLTILAALVLALVVKNLLAKRKAYNVDDVVVMPVYPAYSGEAPAVRPTFGKKADDEVKPASSFLFDSDEKSSSDKLFEDLCLASAGLVNDSIIV